MAWHCLDLCRVKVRRELLGGDDEAALAQYGHAGMYGRLIEAVTNFIREGWANLRRPRGFLVRRV
jgi:hypothetical protein